MLRHTASVTAFLVMCPIHHFAATALPLHSRVRAMRANTASSCNAERETFTVPCFPLHKRHRLPTDFVGLNLHEPRYLALADAVLEFENRTFGAVYSGSSPHFIRDGVGSPTPMLSSGQHGVFCEMIQSTEVWTKVPMIGHKRKVYHFKKTYR